MSEEQLKFLPEGDESVGLEQFRLIVEYLTLSLKLHLMHRQVAAPVTVATRLCLNECGGRASASSLGGCIRLDM
jgi:hypothetical protein